MGIDHGLRDNLLLRATLTLLCCRNPCFAQPLGEQPQQVGEPMIKAKYDRQEGEPRSAGARNLGSFAGLKVTLAGNDEAGHNGPLLFAELSADHRSSTVRGVTLYFP
jgi:hypothetical protein